MKNYDERLKTLYKNQSGQSIIELAVAAGLASIALVAILSMIVFSIGTQRRSSNYYIATNLAREAIEVARNMRDTNWLEIEAGLKDKEHWNDFLYDANNYLYSGILRFDPDNLFPDTQSYFSFKFLDVDLLDPGLLDQQKTVYRKDINASLTTVYLDYDTCQTCQPTIFKRLVYLKPICDGSGSNSNLFNDSRCPRERPADPISNFICDNGGICDPVNAPQIGIRVIVQVDWREASRLVSLKLADDLYNWR